MKPKKFSVPSFTNPKKNYVVTKQGKTFKCSCPNWIYRQAQCKHIRLVKEAA
jgi:hypothetical protein